MTRRERAEARLERRREWAEGWREKAAAAYAVGDPYRGDIAFNTQPGHIPARARVIAATERSFEHSAMAEHHEAKAAGTERMLKHTIFSDDDNAVEALRAKIDRMKATVEKMKAANKIVRKHKEDRRGGLWPLMALGFTEEQAHKLFEPDFAGRVGFPTYALTNDGANIRRMEARIVEIERNRQHQAQAEASGGVVIEGNGPTEFGDWVRITFAEKPEREILDALRAAGFRWGGVSWSGERAKIPACVLESITATSPTDALNNGFKFDPVTTAIVNQLPETPATDGSIAVDAPVGADAQLAGV
jgi:hypothetical protein